MPQKMNVVCCCSCQMYQVHIVKKAKKWECKVCGVKQSFMKIYLEGSGSDCRAFVQQLNFSKSEQRFNIHNSYNDNNENLESINEKDGSSDLDEESKVFHLDNRNFENDFSCSSFACGKQFQPAITSNNRIDKFECEENAEVSFNEDFHYSSRSPDFSNITDVNQKIEKNVVERSEKEENNPCRYRVEKRQNEDVDSSMPIKKAKIEGGFVNLIDDSDSDHSERDETKGCDDINIFESDGSIDFSLDF